MGLRSCDSSPCLFTGVLIPGEPPIFVGIYVDDIIYFSCSDKVEKKFGEGLSTIGSVDFMGQVSLFLGTEFTCIPFESMSASARDDLQPRYQSLVGSLNWLAHTTRPDISTVVSLLAQYQSEPFYWSFRCCFICG